MIWNMDGSTSLLAQGLLSNPMVMMFCLVVAIPIVFMSVFGLIQDLRKQEVKRVDDRLMGKTPKRGEKSEDELRKSLIKKQALAGAGTGFLKSFGQFKPIEKLQTACMQADLDWNAARVVFRLLVASAGTFFLGLMVVGPGRAAILALPILCGPIVYIYFRKKRRLQALVEQLPEVFEALVGALRAGQSLPTAIGLVAGELPEPSRTEFGLVYQEQNLGIPIEDALGNMRQRLDQMDISFFVTAVQIQKQSGGNLAEVLENIGSIIRARIQLFGQVRVLTAEGRMSGIILLALPPVMILVMMFMNPDYASKLTDTDIGHKLLIGAGVAEFLGWAMIRKIIDIKV
ncbi:MAG: type II secretion system F family protein [Phycisphaerae bacterium]